MNPGTLSNEAQRVDPSLSEGFQLVVARVRQALAKVGESLDSALKADPYHGAIEFGVRALRSVVGAAEKAGKPIPFEVMLAAGVQVVKDLASIANEKGYLDDSEIETFLKEVLQQAMQQFIQLDADEGKMSPEQANAVGSKIAEAQGAMGSGGAADDEAGEAPQEEAAESPDEEAAEVAQEPDEMGKRRGVLAGGAR